MNNIYRQYDILIKHMVTILSEKYKFDKEEALEHLGFEKEYPQSQSHGFMWENEIRVKVFELPPEMNDTKKNDICCEQNKFDNNENCSIKTTGGNDINCSDILRFFDGDFDKKYTIILIKYKQESDTKKTVKEILEINYTIELRNILFGTITRGVLEEYINLIKAIPPGSASEEIKKEYKLKKNMLQKEYNMRINISPKVDSSTQRRVQCSITKIDELFKQYPHFIISQTTEPILRGVYITKEITSTKRIRNVI